jgi:hypothetical protein
MVSFKLLLVIFCRIFLNIFMFANCFSPLAVVPYLYSYTTCFDLDYSLPYSIHVYLEAKYELNDKLFTHTFHLVNKINVGHALPGMGILQIMYIFLLA